jgi:hypothetical protein
VVSPYPFSGGCIPSVGESNVLLAVCSYQPEVAATFESHANTNPNVELAVISFGYLPQSPFGGARRLDHFQRGHGSPDGGHIWIDGPVSSMSLAHP